MATDPNWLLATLAQSAAAIVAIVGGFLASRVVSFDAERSAVAKRLAEVEDELEVRLNHLSKVHEQRLSVSVDWFRSDYLGNVVEANGEMDPNQMKDLISVGMTDEEAHDAARTLIHDVQGAQRQLDHVAARGLTVTTLKQAQLAGVNIPDELEGLFKAIIERRSRTRGLAGTLFTSGHLGLGSVPSRDTELERQEKRIRDERQIANEIDRLRVQKERLQLQRTSVEVPTSLIWGLAVLAYLAVVGVVVPLVMMASRPVPNTMTWRRVVVGLFISGLIALVFYLVHAIRDIRARKTPEIADITD